MSEKLTDIKGLDGLAKDFLFNGSSEQKALIKQDQGYEATDKQLKAWVRARTEEFVNRSGQLCEDVTGYFTELMEKRGLDNTEGIFAMALMAINLRYNYAHSPRDPNEQQNGVSEEKIQERLDEFDKICYHAQTYFDENS